MPRAVPLFLLCSLLAAGVLALPRPARAQSVTLTLPAQADARVAEAYPTSNFGTSTTLQTDAGTGSAVETLLRFDVQGLQGPVISAKLRLFSSSGTVDGPTAYLTEATWSETAVTWQTRPTAKLATGGDLGAVAASTWVEIDVTALVQSSGPLGLLLAQTVSDGVHFKSRESSTTTPELVVVYDASGSPPPPPPPPSGTATLTLQPVADARVAEAAPSKSYGTSSTLTTDGGSGAHVETLLRFQIQGIGAGTVTSATLRLRANSGTVDGPAVFLASGPWSEAVTWTTRPATVDPGLPPIADVGAIAAGSWVQWTVTPFVSGDGTLDLKLRQEGTDSVTFGSRESSAKPELVVVVETGPCPGGCDDGNACTSDACDETAKACSHTATPGPCSDGDACTSGDTCQADTCVAGTPTVCEDGDACTIDGCVATTGACSFVPSSAPGCLTTFQRHYGTSSDDKGQGLAGLPDGGYVMVGKTSGGGAGAEDAWVVRTDGCGAVTWQRTLGGSGFETANSVLATSDGSLLVVGQSKTWAGMYAARLSATGSTQWAYSYTRGGYDSGHTALQRADGGFVVLGETYVGPPGDGSKHNTVLAGLDASGGLQWMETYGGDIDGDEGRAIVQTRDAQGNPDGFLVAGAAESWGFGNDDVWLLRTDLQGKHKSSILYGKDGDDEANHLAATPDGGYAVTGYTRGFGAQLSDVFLLKVDGAGNLQWLRRYGGAGDEEGRTVLPLADGFLVGGWTESFGAGSADFVVLRTDLEGKLLWVKTYGGSQADHGWTLAKAKDGGFAVVGPSYSYRTGSSSGTRDFLLVKAGPDGDSGCNQLAIALASVATAKVTPSRLDFTPGFVSGGSRRSTSTQNQASGGSGKGLCGCL